MADTAETSETDYNGLTDRSGNFDPPGSSVAKAVESFTASSHAVRAAEAKCNSKKGFACDKCDKATQQRCHERECNEEEGENCNNCWKDGEDDAKPDDGKRKKCQANQCDPMKGKACGNCGSEKEKCEANVCDVANGKNCENCGTESDAKGTCRDNASNDDVNKECEKVNAMMNFGSRRQTSCCANPKCGCGTHDFESLESILL